MSNLALKRAILETEKFKYVVAAEAEINPSLLSQYLSGNRKPTRDHQARLAKVLNRSVEELFPDDQVMAS